MAFKVDDWVVHPQHGVGRVVKLETRQFDSGMAQQYYKISIPNGTIWVQVDGSSCGLRKVITKSDLARYRDLLKSRPIPLIGDYRQRQVELTDRLRQGSFQARCEVVRDLTALGWYKPLGESNTAILRVAQQALYQEWATAQGLSLIEATREVENLLQEGRQMYKK
jgi:RNA polymerase-interacting CarD/CdnL/TRCF family regulator